MVGYVKGRTALGKSLGTFKTMEDLDQDSGMRTGDRYKGLFNGTSVGVERKLKEITKCEIQEARRLPCPVISFGTNVSGPVIQMI